MADVSFPAGTIGLVIPFVLEDNGAPLSNAQSATVTWLGDDGSARLLSLASAVSAEFTYVTSATEFTFPTQFKSVLRVSFGGNVFYAPADGSLSVRITPNVWGSRP